MSCRTKNGSGHSKFLYSYIFMTLCPDQSFFGLQLISASVYTHNYSSTSSQSLYFLLIICVDEYVRVNAVALLRNCPHVDVHEVPLCGGWHPDQHMVHFVWKRPHYSSLVPWSIFLYSFLIWSGLNKINKGESKFRPDQYKKNKRERYKIKDIISILFRLPAII